LYDPYFRASLVFFPPRPHEEMTVFRRIAGSPRGPQPRSNTRRTSGVLQALHQYSQRAPTFHFRVVWHTRGPSTIADYLPPICLLTIPGVSKDKGDFTFMTSPTSSFSGSYVLSPLDNGFSCPRNRLFTSAFPFLREAPFSSLPRFLVAPSRFFWTLITG